MTPLVTVVLPARDRGAVVGRAIESVVRQTFEHWEAIVVDDGSGDDTREVAAGWAGRDARISLLRHERPLGAQAARNTGIRAARGEWIAFLDSDDEYLPDSLRARLAEAGSTGRGVVHSECLVRDGKGEQRPFGVPPLAGNVYVELLRRPGPLLQALMARRDLVLAIGGLDERVPAFQEWDTSIRLARLAEFGFVARPTFVYDTRLEATISKDLLRAARGYCMIVAKHRREILARAGLRALSDHYLALAGLYRAAGHSRQRLASLALGAALWPFRPAPLKRLLARRAGAGGHGGAA